jgi:hypothetical protein
VIVMPNAARGMNREDLQAFDGRHLEFCRVGKSAQASLGCGAYISQLAIVAAF